MTILGALVALLAVWFAGACLLGLVGARDTRSPAGLVADFAAGGALLGFVGTVSVAAGIGVSWLTLYGPLALLATGAVLRRCRPLLRIRLPGDRPARALLLLAVAGLIVLGIGALGDLLWWDGWAIWAFKAKVLFVTGTLPPSFFDPSGPYVATNLHYPLAVPLLSWWTYLHAGASDPALVSLVGAVWFALLVLLVWGSLSDSGAPRLAAGAALGVTAFWPISSYALGGTADVVIAIVLLGSIVEMGRARTDGGAGPAVRLAAYLSLGVLAKSEGLAIAAIVAATGLPMLWLSGGGKSLRMLGAAIVPLLVYLPWHLFTIGQELTSAAVGTRSAQPWQERANVLRIVTEQLISEPIWMPVCLLGLGGLALAARRRDAAVLTGWAVLVAYVGAVIAVYLRTDADIVWLVATSYARVMAVVVPAAVVLSLAAVAKERSGSETLPTLHAEPAARG
jgi:hypothetical protein